MDSSGVGANGAPFVGEQRHKLVERLLAEFDHVSQFGKPRWWSLEEHSGWGKTRIVQELYRRLAAERQPGAKYWPTSLLPQAPVLEDAGPWMAMRRRVSPEEVIPEPAAVPQWFWWGISCATRSGTPVQALADDLTQFVEHQVGLEQRWRQLASPKARLGAEGSAEPGEVVETAAGEVLGVAAGLANLPVPGLGVLALTAKWGVPGRRDGRLLAQGSPVAEAAGRIRSDLVDELAPALERLGAAGLPIVITIEDLHLADESLVELLARILATQGAPVLVISTAWRGLLDEDSRPAHRLIERVEPDRICRVLTDKALPDLATSERQVIVSATLPDASAWNANLLAQTYTNPLALQLACNVGWVRQAQRNLTADDVAGLPRDVDGLFTQLWKELPEDTCQALMVATLSTPTAISESLGFGDARWDSSLLTAVSKTEAWPRASAADLSAVLAQTSDASAWVRSVDQWLRRFPDPVQYDVAVGQAKVEYDDAERRLLYEAMARGMSPGVVKSPSQRLHRARLLVALASEGFLAWDETTLAGAVTLCSSLLAGSDSNGRRHVIRIVESALRSTSTEPPVAGPLLTLRGKYERALAESGRVAEAITAFEQLLADQRRVLGPDDPNTLTTRSNLASWLGESGQVAEAITACEQLLADRTRVQGPDALDTLTTRGNLASWLARSGRLAEAITASEQLLADQSRVLGPDAPETLTARSNLASWLGESGRVAEAITAFEQLLADQRRVLGPDSPQTLATRGNLAGWLAGSGRVAEAITAYEQLLVDRTRVFGSDNPDTLATRGTLAGLLAKSGRLAEAVTASEQLLVDQSRVLGPDDPATLTTRSNLASWLGESGRVAEAITAFEQLLADQRRVLGPDDPNTLTTRNNLAGLLGESGWVAEAITAYEQLLAVQSRVLGPDDPGTLATRRSLAELLGRSGRVAEAITALEQLLADQRRVLGADAPDSLATRDSVAGWLGRSGRLAEAITALEQLLADRTRLLGADNPATLDTRNNLAGWLGRSGRVAEATTAFEQLLADRTRLLGADAPETLDTRNNLAWSLVESGRVAEAITAFEQLLADQSRVLGPDDPQALFTRSNLAGSLGRSGRVAEAITAFEQLLADQSRVLGPDDPQALFTRSNLAGLLVESGRLAEAVTACEQLLADRTRVLGPDAPQTLTTRSNLDWLEHRKSDREGSLATTA